MSETITYRKMCDADIPYVFSTALHNSREYVKNISWPERRAIVDALVHSADVYVAEAEGVLLGWAAYINDTLMYIYVQKDARHNGIATGLHAESSRSSTIHPRGASVRGRAYDRRKPAV